MKFSMEIAYTLDIKVTFYFGKITVPVGLRVKPVGGASSL